MRNLIDFVKDKIYYIMAATILLVIVLIAINACSGISTKTYDSIESDMVNAAKKYYSSRKDKLPSEINETISVTTGTLIEAELLEEIVDPNKKENKCQGYVQVKKLDDGYVYTPFLSCKGSYEPKYLSDVVKESGTDEYGNGVYLIDNEYVYRGDDVNNYVEFNEQTWRILRVNSNNEIKIILDDKLDDEYEWDTSFNVVEDEYVGITSDYLNTNIRKLLLSYYKDNFTDDSKAKLVKKSWCIGGLLDSDNFNSNKECAKIKENEYVGLINVSDYGAATLDTNCSNPQQEQCTNRNYLVSSKINTWTMNTDGENTYQVYVFVNGNIFKSYASDSYSVNPVVYLSGDTVAIGNGTKEEPYVVK